MSRATARTLFFIFMYFQTFITVSKLYRFNFNYTEKETVDWEQKGESQKVNMCTLTVNNKRGPGGERTKRTSNQTFDRDQKTIDSLVSTKKKSLSISNKNIFPKKTKIQLIDTRNQKRTKNKRDNRQEAKNKKTGFFSGWYDPSSSLLRSFFSDSLSTDSCKIK